MGLRLTGRVAAYLGLRISTGVARVRKWVLPLAHVGGKPAQQMGLELVNTGLTKGTATWKQVEQLRNFMDKYPGFAWTVRNYEKLGKKGQAEVESQLRYFGFNILSDGMVFLP